MSDQIDQRWTSCSSLNVEDPTVGTVRRFSTEFIITIPSENQSNTILAPVPTPNVTEGWKVKAVMLRYHIFSAVSGQLVGAIFDSVAIRDGDIVIPGFTGLDIGMPNTGTDTGWKTAKLELPVPANFQFGLGVSIHANHIQTNLGNIFPAVFSLASVGLEYIRPGVVGPSPVDNKSGPNTTAY